MTNNSCISVERAKVFVAILSALPVVAMVSSALSIAMILRVKAYRTFSYRLMLYLAIAGAIHTVGLWLEVLPVDIQQPDHNLLAVRKGWNGVCVFSGFFSQYSGFSVTFIMVWMSVYIFFRVLFLKRLGKPYLEKAGALLVAFGPIIFAWVPFIQQSYGLRGVTCWIRDSCSVNSSWGDSNVVFVLAVGLVPHLVLRLISLAMILTAVFSLCRNTKTGLLKHAHWLAAMEILPLIPLPFLDIIIGLVRIIFDSLGKRVFGAEYDYVLSDVVHSSMLQVVFLAVPFGLLLQPSFRRDLRRSIRLCNQRRGSLGPSQDNASHVQDVQRMDETECTVQDMAGANGEEDCSILVGKKTPSYTPLY